MGFWTGEQRQKPTGHVGIQAMLAGGGNGLGMICQKGSETIQWLRWTWHVTPPKRESDTSHLLVWESLRTLQSYICPRLTWAMSLESLQTIEPSDSTLVKVSNLLTTGHQRHRTGWRFGLKLIGLTLAEYWCWFVPVERLILLVLNGLTDVNHQTWLDPISRG